MPQKSSGCIFNILTFGAFVHISQIEIYPKESHLLVLGHILLFAWIKSPVLLNKEYLPLGRENCKIFTWHYENRIPLLEKIIL
jgi:hypothetical protein